MCLLFGVGVNIKGEGIMQLFCMNAYILVSALAAKFTVDFTVLHSVWWLRGVDFIEMGSFQGTRCETRAPQYQQKKKTSSKFLTQVWAEFYKGSGVLVTFFDGKNMQNQYVKTKFAT